MEPKIYKYPLELVSEQTIMLPGLLQVLSVQEQHGELCMWAMVQPDSEQQLIKTKIYIVGTGNPVPKELLDPENVLFIDTVQMGRFVWHVFMRAEL